MEGDLIHINDWLRPLSWLYGCGIWFRNLMFDLHILKEQRYDRPVICIGNITVGGTGKTPHTEMLIDMLQPSHRVAVLSRGYKRKSRGYRLAQSTTSMQEIGDEPWQIKNKFPETIVAVDANRRRGLKHLFTDAETSDLDVVLLDDAFQHRYVRAGLNILLTDYHRLISDDALLPAGRLREPVSSKDRADIILVTKCPEDMKPMDYRVISHSLSPKPFQHLFFTSICYGRPYRLFSDTPGSEEELTPDTYVLLLTGIASPQQMVMDLQRTTRHIIPLPFADHHDFSRRDIQKIEDEFSKLQGSKRIIMTTEKDAARLLPLRDVSPIIRRSIYVYPITTKILRGQEEEFQQLILGFVDKQADTSKSF
ncbi:MAG: tetraacyldisaccharide 4'-kinase [Bacteroidaceae bacterium]|nr:tetraacyldisaccharide 4'-kinase [Bacteroidaceae bacterium]